MEQRDQDLGTTVEQDQAAEQAGEATPEEPIVAEEEQETADQVSALVKELEEAREKEAEYLDGWQRARAELANARKRFQREQEQAYANARADLLVRLLPVVDDFERAFTTPPEGIEEAWLGGVQLIWRKLQTFLQQEGVTPIEAVGRAFDPYLHQAVTHEPSETVPEGHVLDEMQRGYQMDGRVLRPSMVRVSSGVPEAVAGPKRGDEDRTSGESGAPGTGDQNRTDAEPAAAEAGVEAETMEPGETEARDEPGEAAI